MSIIFLMIGASLFLAIFFLIAFFWATKKGQFEDTYTPSVRMLFEDEFNQKNTTDGNREV